MEKNLPTYKMVVSDTDDESGVDFVALVDDPAIQVDWLAFNNDELKFKATNLERRIITGPLMLADTKIYRRSKELGEYYVVFDAPTIEQIVQKFFKMQKTSNVNEMHETPINDVYMFESFIVDSKRGILPPKQFKNITDGSWFGSYKVDNTDVWENFIKTGEFKGFSVEGMFGMDKLKMREDSTFIEFSEWLDNNFC